MIRVALDGLSHGHVAFFLEEFQLRREEVELAGIRIYDEAERALIPDWFDGLVLDSSEELLDRCRPQVVVVCGVYDERARVAAAALRAGVHVLADKPLAPSLAELELVSEAAAGSDAVLSVAFEKRWYPATGQARELIRAGALGDLRLIAATGPHKLLPQRRGAWFFDGRYGSILADLPIHDIDLALDLTDGRQGTVAGWVSPCHRDSRSRFADACAVTLTVEDRVWASIDAHWRWPDSSGVHGRYQMRLTGTAGTLYIDWADNTVAVETDAAVDVRAAEARGRELAKRPAEDFFDAIRAGRVPEVDTAASLAASRVALLAVDSAARGGSPLAWTRPS